MKRLLEKFFSYTRFKQIAIVVILLHCLAVLALTIHHLAIFQSPKRPIVVRSRSFASTTLAQTTQPKKSPAKSTAQKSPPAPTKTKPTPPSKNPTPKASNKPTVSKSTPKPTATTQSDLLEELTQNLDAFTSETPAPPKSSLSLPSAITHKASIEQEGSTEIQYGEAVIGYLQSTLDLPERGAVKALIEIDRFGNPIRCDIIETKSRQNGEFLKKRLPELSFPCFNDFGILSQTLEFTITFHNVETR